MKDLIYIENDKSNEFDSLQELYEFIFGKHYFFLTEKERFIRRYEIAFYMIKFYGFNFDIVHTSVGTLNEMYKIKSEQYDLNKSVVIDNEREFIMSLCKLPNITILESKNSDNLLSSEEKKKYKGNYIMIDNYIRQGNKK